jgi:hypothetical protein
MIGPERPKSPAKDRPDLSVEKKNLRSTNLGLLPSPLDYCRPILILKIGSIFDEHSQMSFRPSLLSRWLAQAELRRATPASRQTLSILQRQPSLSSQVSQTMRRSLTTATNYTSRVMPRSRPGLRSVQLPRQRTNRRFNSGSSSNASEPSKEGGSVSQRLRKLSREYGWAALGVYLTLSALDFPICFAAVRLLGPERIGHYEHVVVQSVKNTFPSIWPETKTEGEEDGSLVQTEASKYEEASRFFPS